MKFYYNNQLVRTSKTMEYKYAIVLLDGDKVRKTIACSESYENIVKRYHSEMRFPENCLKNHTALLKARREGAETFINHEGKRERTKNWHCTDEQLEAYIEEEENRLNDYYSNAKIVELEAR